jgi:hypothetical protein
VDCAFQLHRDLGPGLLEALITWANCKMFLHPCVVFFVTSLLSFVCPFSAKRVVMNFLSLF